MRAIYVFLKPFKVEGRRLLSGRGGGKRERKTEKRSGRKRERDRDRATGKDKERELEKMERSAPYRDFVVKS